MSQREHLLNLTATFYAQPFVDEQGDFEYQVETMIDFHPGINSPEAETAILADLLYYLMQESPNFKEAAIMAINHLKSNE